MHQLSKGWCSEPGKNNLTLARKAAALQGLLFLASLLNVLQLLAKKLHFPYLLLMDFLGGSLMQWVGMEVGPLIPCSVTQGKLLHFLVPQFLQL